MWRTVLNWCHSSRHMLEILKSEIQIRCKKLTSIEPTCVISIPNPMFDHLLESSRWDDSNTWSNVGFGEEMGIVAIKICSVSGALLLRACQSGCNRYTNICFLIQGSPQWVQVEFETPVSLDAIHIQFQGGFAGRKCWLEGKTSNTEGSRFGKLEDFYPEDINSLQVSFAQKVF